MKAHSSKHLQNTMANVKLISLTTFVLLGILKSEREAKATI